MTQAEQLASFVLRATYDDLSGTARSRLKSHVLDAIACAIGALDGEPIRIIEEQIADFNGAGQCTLIGGGTTAPDRAAFYNSALVRYLDFNDSYLAKGETCHPSDNLGAILAAGEYANRSGKDFLTSLAVAYQVQCRLSDVAPVRAKGFDHVVQGLYALAAGISKVLELGSMQTANAIAICGTAFNPLRVTRTGLLSHWKGLAYPNAAFCCTHATFLAMRGITGPLEVFEGDKGFMDTIAGKFEIDWEHENLEKVTETIIKKYNAEIHSQSTLEGVLELKEEHGIQADDVERIEIETFDVAYNIIGGGEEGDKTIVESKEEADHSLPYLVAVALLEGQVMPEQYTLERIARQDVQQLLRRVHVQPVASYSQSFPNEMPCRVTIILRNGQVLNKEKQDYEGFKTRPMGWDGVVHKFERLTSRFIGPNMQREIVEVVGNLELLQIVDLTSLLSNIVTPQRMVA